jgi:uncharacterized protein
MEIDIPDREFQVFVKPAGAECNLHCRYCYYLDKSALYGNIRRPLMSDEILEKYIAGLISATTGNEIFFSWHGGEPVLAGIDFFRKAVKLQKQYQPTGKRILNGIQTNATMLNDEFCRFLSDEGFFAGVSFDGPEELHDKFRVTGNGKGSFKESIRGYELLKNHNVATELLSVVHIENVYFPLKVYNFLKSLGSEYITFLPLVVRGSQPGSGVSRISVPSEPFGSFLMTVFDEWVAKDIGRIKIQIIEEAARTAFDQEHTLCIFKKRCGGVPVVEHNGDFYSCDHFADKEHLLGNISKIPLAELLDSEKQKRFGQAKSDTLPRQCRVCEVKEMCNGECPRNRFAITPDGEPGLNYLCQGYRRFFNHIKPFIVAIREEWLKGVE